MYKYDATLSKSSKSVLKQLDRSDKISHRHLKFLDAITCNCHSYIRRKMADNFFLCNSCYAKDVAIRNFYLNNIDNAHTIRVREYIPSIKCNDIILFVHGGGWVQGNLETHDALCRSIANVFVRRVISVEYRLSPQYKFPIPLSDVFDAYIWCVNQGYENIILSGDSVGGNLCAALCVKLRDLQYYQFPVSQILFYPILSCNLESKSFDLFGRGYGLTKEWTKNYIYQYTGAEHDDERFINNKFIYPLLEDAGIFPKTFLISASCDVLLDDQLVFADKLKSAKIPVYHTILDGSIHGFMTYDKYFNNDINSILVSISTKLQ